jgi:uncharacterized protein (TIGR00159 family)
MQPIREILYSLGPANIADIVIMAVLIYSILAWLKGTRAFQILGTVFGMGIVYYSALQLGLTMTSVLFQYLWAAIIVVLVIVFQPEIRDMMDRVSPVRYLSGRRNNEVEAGVLEEVVEAVAELARLKIGALLILPRQDRLDHLLLVGKRLDCLVSAETLIAIFQKGSPLHDGAVLMSRNRIKAASCILPVSTDESLAGRYGTRHRAALGLTEQCDALCIAVSEERGEVSLAEGREITLYRKKGDFRQDLERALAGVRESASRTMFSPRAFIVSNWGLKLASLAIAIGMWSVIVGPQTAELGISVPIQYTNLPEGMEITGKWRDRVDVRVKGSETSLANLRPGAVKVVLDLGKVTTGPNFFRITHENVQLPPGISIATIRFSDLQLKIAAHAVKKVRVIPTILGTIPPHLTVKVRPAHVNVRALEHTLKTIQSLSTEAVRASELLEKREVPVPLAVKPGVVKIEAVEPTEVTIVVENRS